MLKYKDYYYGTTRYEFPIVEKIEDAIHIEPKELKCLDEIQRNLLRSFPFDLWDQE